MNWFIINRKIRLGKTEK